DAIRRAMSETDRRREIQAKYNEANGVVPETVVRNVDDPLLRVAEGDYATPRRRSSRRPLYALDAPAAEKLDDRSLVEKIRELEKRMRDAAKALEFEEAARFRDEIRELRELQVFR